MDATVTRRKRGEPHPSVDGLVFIGYHSTSRGRVEHWGTAEQLEKKRRRGREDSARVRAERPEREKERHAQYRAGNAWKIKERHALYRVANLERVKERDARWRAANREKTRAMVARRRARKLNATHPDHSAEIEAVLLQSAVRLRKCLGVDFHIDHVVPLSRGGKHHHANLRVLPGRLNVAKSDRLDSELQSHLQAAMKAWSPFLN